MEKTIEENKEQDKKIKTKSKEEHIKKETNIKVKDSDINNIDSDKKNKKGSRKGFKKFKKMSKTNIILNILILTLVAVYAWMITDASRAEMTEYAAKLIVTDSNVDVKFYTLVDGTYVIQEQDENAPLLKLDNIEPGSNIKYRFDVENKTDILGATKIVFSGITGDIDALKDYIYVGATNPTIFNYKLSDIIKYDEENKVYYFNFIEYFKVPAKSTESIYFNISLSEKATNEIQDKEISIDKIMFLYP